MEKRFNVTQSPRRADVGMTARPVSDEPLMPLADVAARLGIPIKTFRRWRDHGRAPLGYRLGGRIQYRWSEVEAWLQQQREQPRERQEVRPLRMLG